MDSEKNLLDIIKNYLDSKIENNTFSELNFDNIHYIQIDEYKCKCRELTWKEAAYIDYASFANREESIYFSSEKEKRKIIKKSLLQIIDSNNRHILPSIDSLSHEFIEKYWAEYQKYLHLDLDEANIIYNSSKKYFDPNNKDYYALHPLIIQVDYMTKGIVHLSKKEFDNLTLREFEAIQLILSTKNEIDSSHNRN